MNLDVFEQRFFDSEFKSKKEMTKAFNELSVDDRLDFLDELSKEEKTKFISDIRTQAVKDFWTHEQSLIKEGKCTRDWTPNQVEDILNISEKTGMESINGDAAIDIDGKKYFGHHMMNVAEYPEYAGDWRNIQALDYNEHYQGAHAGNTKNPTRAYYEPETGKNIPVDLSKLEKGADVKSGQGYIPEKKCIFKSDAEINNSYSKHGSINSGERLALKNIELSKSSKGSQEDFFRGHDVAKRYGCKDFANKFGVDVLPTNAAEKSNIIDRNDSYSNEPVKNNKSKMRINNAQHISRTQKQNMRRQISL